MLETDRKLATIRIIEELHPIENADKIELAIVDGWQVVVKKDEFNVGDKVVYCEIDSFLPIKPEYEFLRASSYKKLVNGDEGFRLKTVKLRGQISQGLILPVTREMSDLDVYSNVTEMLNITKWEPILPAELSGLAKGRIPYGIPKTDEERIQNLKNKFNNDFKSRKFFVTEKLDGTSCTIYYRDGDFGVTGRNVDFKEECNNTLWQVAKSYGLESKIPEMFNGHNIAIRGEIVGPGIQGNKYKLTKPDLYVYNIWDIDKYSYFPKHSVEFFANKLGLKTVPKIEDDFSLPETVNDLLLMSEGKSALNNNSEREGLVFACCNDANISFKVISNKFLLKEKD